VKGKGKQSTHHANEDQGSVVVYARGENFLIDPGYFEPAARDHTLPLLGQYVRRKSWDPRAEALLSDTWESGDRRGITVDATGAYVSIRASKDKPASGSIRRVIVQIGDKAVIWLDDISAPQNLNQATVQYQCGFPVKLDKRGTGCRIIGAKSDLAIRINGPETRLICKGLRKFSQAWWVYGKTGVQWHPARGNYTIDSSKPMITVCTPLSKDDAEPEVRVTRKGGAITVSIAGEDPVVFKRVNDRWRSQDAPVSMPRNVLFIGDSFTSGPSKKVIAHLPRTPEYKDVKHSQITRDGDVTIQWHYTEKNVRQIEDNKYDLIVLQDYSGMAFNTSGTLSKGRYEPPRKEPWSKVERRRHLGPKNFSRGVRNFRNVARVHGGKVMLYMTWADLEKRDKDGKLKDKLTYVRKQKKIADVHLKAAKDYDCRIIPVGLVWKEVHDADKELWRKLYAKDGRHASVKGMWLIAATMAAYMYDLEPESLTDLMGAVTEDEAEVIRSALKKVMIAHARSL
jgi:hypothetical protein